MASGRSNLVLGGVVIGTLSSAMTARCGDNLMLFLLLSSLLADRRLLQMLHVEKSVGFPPKVQAVHVQVLIRFQSLVNVVKVSIKRKEVSKFSYVSVNSGS